ncbi:imelysin family protein [Photobacterium alginatilyticum]|uniref:imelysin family protein n=1 Tax=Photobacterium alginatilyticum TaxID=1775171 RepID=UPI004068BEAC
MKLSVTSLSAVAIAMAVTGCNDQQQSMTGTIHQQHLQAAELFADASRQANSELTALCQSYDENQLEAARQSWQQVMHKWMALQGREKGSEEALALSWQIQFWPDKKNTTGRKLNQLLKQDTAWTAADIAEQSVAVQGLGAVEWFLYEKPTLLQSGKGCLLAGAIGDRLQQSGEQLTKAWQSNPWQQLTPQMALGEYLGALNNQLDYSMKKLTRPLGKPGSPKTYQTESWRSQTSLGNLKVNVEAMQQLYLADGKGLDALLRQRGYVVTADQISNRFSSLLESWPETDAMVPMLKTKEGYRELLNIYNGLEYIQIALQDDVATELGIVVGFNATDGD